MLALSLPETHVLGAERLVIGQQCMSFIHLCSAERAGLRQTVGLAQHQSDLLAETPVDHSRPNLYNVNYSKARRCAAPMWC